MTSQSGVLRSRPALALALVFCVYEGLPRSLTTLGIAGREPFTPAALLIFGTAFAAVIAAAIALRSPFAVDRRVFGAAAAAFAVRFLALLAEPKQPLAGAAEVLRSLLWAAAAVVSLLALAKPARDAHR